MAPKHRGEGGEGGGTHTQGHTHTHTQHTGTEWQEMQGRTPECRM